MIDLDDVFVLYPCGDRQIAALRGLTLAVAPSERVVVTGPSGSGKSTLIRLVTGLVRPSAGSAVVLEHDLANASGRAILALQRTGIGVITQQTVNNLAKELSCVDNVAMQCRLTGQSRAEAVDQAEVMLSRLGVGHLARRSLDTLSAGEAQRVALAAALAHRPRVIVADEPTGALDLDNANIVFDLLAELSDDLQAALLVVSHDPGAGRIGHRVLEIRDGRLGSEYMAGADAPTLVVDKRGWVRLPERDRLRSGITERAAVDAGTPTSSELVLISPDGVPAPEEVSDRDDTKTIAPFTPLLTLTDVSRTIGTTQVLAPTTISIGAGQLLIVSGRSGSGKTTLLGLIAGFTAPTSGTIDRTGRARVAVAAANPGFAETMTARENIALAWTVRGGHVDRHVRDTIDQHLADMGLIELADRAASTLSGGERQRLSVVRAIVSDAELVLLDEPTSQLDQGMARRMAAFLRAEAATGRAIVCASHEPELIAAADRVYALAGREPSPSTATKEPAHR